jgi:tetratricopeptide (TPR) repeat protein
MSGRGNGGVVERAHDAAGRGAWREAFDLFTEADAAGSVGLADLPVFGNVAYAAGHLDATIELWERAYVGLSAAGEDVMAAGAAVQVAMHLLFDTALMAPVRGWLTRAEQLLDADGETPAHAWAAVVRSYERLLIGDRERALQCARRAGEIGSKCDPAAAAIGHVAEARILILDDEVTRGLALLEQAGVAASSGALDALSTGVVYCELVCALQGLAQYDLAQEWTEVMERWSRTNAIGSLHGRCRVHRAEILRLRGHCYDAEVQALLACDELRPYLRRELGWPLTELGRIRLCRGDLDGAEEALLAAHHAGWDPQPGLARVRLAQGDLPTAAALIREALESPSLVPSKELPPSTDLRRAPLLEAQVEIAVANNDLERARSAADELELVAARFESKALVACASVARARVRLAEGDAGDAARLFSDAARAWGAIGAPYEEAIARLGLADAYRALGSEHQAAMEADAGRAALARIAREPVPDAPTGSRRDQGDEQSVEARNTFRREGDAWLLVFEGRAARVRDLKGMNYLARLLADPEREFHVLDLVGNESTRSGQAEGLSERLRRDLGSAGEMLDSRAKNAYRRRLAEIDEDLERARQAADSVREAQADAEREFLVRELSRAVGLGGRGRRAGDASERARSAVTRAVRQAMGRIGEHHPELGEHLGRTIRTGTYCCYSPDPRIPADWAL